MQHKHSRGFSTRYLEGWTSNNVQMDLIKMDGWGGESREWCDSVMLYLGVLALLVHFLTYALMPRPDKTHHRQLLDRSEQGINGRLQEPIQLRCHRNQSWQFQLEEGKRIDGKYLGHLLGQRPWCRSQEWDVWSLKVHKHQGGREYLLGYC